MGDSNASVKKSREFVARLHSLLANAPHADAVAPLGFTAASADKCLTDADVLERASVGFFFSVSTPQEVRTQFRSQGHK